MGDYRRNLKTILSRISLALWFLAILCGLAILAAPENWKWRAAYLFITIFAMFGVVMMIYNHIDKKKHKTKETDTDCGG